MGHEGQVDTYLPGRAGQSLPGLEMYRGGGLGAGPPTRGSPFASLVARKSRPHPRGEQGLALTRRLTAQGASGGGGGAEAGPRAGSGGEAARGALANGLQPPICRATWEMEGPGLGSQVSAAGRWLSWVGNLGRGSSCRATRAYVEATPRGASGGGGAWARNKKSLETPGMILGFLREATGKEKPGQKGECLSQPSSYHLPSRTPWVVGTPCVQQGPLWGLGG